MSDAMDDDAGERERPNANYNLSRQDGGKDENEQLIFHYSREHRLEKAPQSVKDIYEQKPKNRLNLLSPLISSKPKALLFFTIIALCAMIFILVILGKFDSTYSLDGNRIDIKSARFEDLIIVIIRKSVSKGVAGYTGAVDLAVSPTANENEDYPVFSHRIFFTLEPEEEYRFTVPFNAAELVMVMQTEKHSVNIVFKPD